MALSYSSDGRRATNWLSPLVRCPFPGDLRSPGLRAIRVRLPAPAPHADDGLDSGRGRSDRWIDDQGSRYETTWMSPRPPVPARIMSPAGVITRPLLGPGGEMPGPLSYAAVQI